ncbi:ABC transporter permease [Mucilaginibacter koreensis]
MLKNYFKTALRNLQKNKGFTLINIFGLALGLATFLLIVLYVVDELSYDRYNTNAGRIYRVNEDLKLGENRVHYAAAMPPLAKVMKTDFPQVEDAVRIKPIYGMHLKRGTELFTENNTAFADASLFNVFTLPMRYGNLATALKEPNSVVLSVTAAKKYFGKLNVVGEMLATDESPLKVTGVIEDMPQQSHFRYDVLVSMATNLESTSPEWLRSNFNTYVLLRKDADYKQIDAKFPQLLRQYSNGQMQTELKMNIDSFERSGSFFRMNLMPLTQIHLHSSMTGELSPNSTVQYVYIFSAIAVFILLIACVNFMNLSTARSADRAREVGVRKVLGSSRNFLIGQFLTESTLLTLGAMLIAVFMAWGALPVFNQLSGKNITVTLHSLVWLVPALLLAVVVIGFIAGSYPAFFLSGFQPIQVLKGKLSAGFKGGRLRSFLVVFQFSVSVFLIIGTLVVYSQLSYIQNRDLGYNRNQVLIVNNVYDLGDHAGTFKQEVKRLPGVTNATLSGFLPTSGNRSTAIFYKTAVTDSKQSIFPQQWVVDEDYIKTLDMKLAAGRSFSAQMPTDTAAVVINETAAKFLGLKNPVDQVLYKSSLVDSKPVMMPYHIIGVVKDFNFSSLRDNITPVILMYGQDHGSLSIRTDSKQLPALIDQLKTRWKELSAKPFKYSFMDADFEASYRAEQQIGKIFIIFTSLAIIIACLGLFGLAAYAAEQRNKEISIRKVLGADVATIIAMLSKDFIRLVLIALVIAIPLAWFFMNQWLQTFAYRQHIQLWILLTAGAGMVMIAFLTVSFQSIKAALVNPVKGLRGE